MVQFAYDFLDVNGRKKRGRIEASSEKEAREALRQRNILVLGLENCKISSLKSLTWKQNKSNLTGAGLVSFTYQLGQLLRAGIPLYEALLSLAEQAKSEKTHPLVLSLCEKVKGGNALSQALNAHPQSFPPLYCALVAAGEAVGTLDETLLRLADLLSKQARWKKQITTSLLYPCVIVLFSFLLILMLLLYVVPSLETLFEEREVNRLTGSVFAVSHFFRNQWIFLSSIPLLCLMGMRIALLKPYFRLRVHRFIHRIPIMGMLILKLALSRFCRTLGTLLQGGVNLLPALQLARQATQHPLLEENLEAVEKRIIEGHLLSQELKKSPLIPPLLSRMLAVGEEGANLAQMLIQVAGIYEEETERLLVRLVSLAQPLFLLITGLFVGLLMLAVLLPLSDITAFLQN